MNFDLQKITVALDLGGYDAAYAGQAVLVWVNLPTALRQKRLALLRTLAREIAAQIKGSAKPPVAWRARFAALRAKFHAPWADDMETLMAAAWSAGADAEAHWSVAEIRKMQSADPLLYAWMTRESWRMVDEWQDARKKK